MKRKKTPDRSSRIIGRGCSLIIGSPFFVGRWLDSIWSSGAKEQKGLKFSLSALNWVIMGKSNLLGSDLSDMERLMVDLGEKRYKGRQLFKWLYRGGVDSFAQMTDLSVPLRAKLADRFVFEGFSPEATLLAADGCEKYLFRLEDGLYIESVLIPEGEKSTLCLSSQVGCPLGCHFCATGLNGFGRDLTTGEILGQLMYVRRLRGADAVHNVVFMGMGEPLLNFDNMVRAVRIISSELGLSLSARRITVSTVGIVPKIYALADSGLKVNLAVSLHAAEEAVRHRLMPVAGRYPLEDLAPAVRYFAEKRKKRITFEYILFKGINDSRSAALSLARFIRGIPCKINILAYNPVAGLPYERPRDDEVDEFARYLYPRAPAVTVRKSRGLDIGAACGQLAGKRQCF